MDYCQWCPSGEKKDKMKSGSNDNCCAPDDDISSTPEQLISYKCSKQLSYKMTKRHLLDSIYIFGNIYQKNSLIFKDEKYTLLSSCLKYIPQACAPPHSSKLVILASFVACFAKRRQPRIILEPNAMLGFHLSSRSAQCKKLVSCHCSAELFWIGPRSRSSWGPYSFDFSYQPFWFLPQRYKSVLSERKGKNV